MRDYGYPALARGEALRGSSAQRIDWVCQQAWLDGAPYDTVYRQRGVWVRAAEVTDPVQRLELGLPVCDRPEAATPHPPVRHPIVGTTSVKVRWTEVHEGIVEVPVQAASTGRAVADWLNANPSWAREAVQDVHGTPFVSEVVMPRYPHGQTGLMGSADLAELADKVRLLVKLGEAGRGEGGRRSSSTDH